MTELTRWVITNLVAHALLLDHYWQHYTETYPQTLIGKLGQWDVGLDELYDSY